MEAPADATNNNSLGLDLDALKINDEPEHPSSSEPAEEEQAPPSAEHEEALKVAEETYEAEAPEQQAPTSPTTEGKRGEGRKKPYVNPDRVKTGGAQREKMSEDELAQKMVRIKEQNEKIKQRRMDVQKDEEAFRKTQEAERIKATKTKKVQENIDRTREQNARRKLEKIQSREWDSGKQGREWNKTRSPDQEMNGAPRASIGIRGGFRGGSGRGRGHGHGGVPPAFQAEAAEQATTPPAAETTAAS
ncbi:uncharacterized protein LAESUDRAFT_704804 [Laetiporus sulphureus 93-53]|uniref:Uncharacterized protein n=1 Tax=Laetiporus sulphureus 93-53 TaxID=1314785 RepID=A0A165CUI7_9APHY|nr:uncharacterized protein LAESUDRAFT_704804 [Laetiporus sulphureus 93-53]KZT03455.1 hypothetical protein LAESUDRAFT_704804 [Laetiporus sulphureus 93-53]